MKIKINRRQLLVWGTPAVAAVTLPVHADMSGCLAPPIVSVTVAPKCAGNPPIGTALFDIFSPDVSAIELKGIEVTSSDPANTLVTQQTFPATITNVISVPLTWDGPASDALTCLPLSEISLTLEYCCEDGPSEFETYDITALLIASIS